ncbi:MAG TPA: nodulation protein NfeD [Myxococcota bacterium]|nr:nodulation protein NfeD [Myxococcota bacterium]
MTDAPGRRPRAGRRAAAFWSARGVPAAPALALALSALALAAAAAPKPAGPLEERRGHVNVARVAGSINPASSDYLKRAISRSEEEEAALLVVELDTPGGLVASTKDIIQAMLNARVPIAVYVSPQGAWAGSAGTFITLAGHIAAMAPGSSIGAAHPVGIGGGGGPRDKDDRPDPAEQKAENLLVAFIESIARERDRNVEWAAKAVRESVAVTADEALRLRVIDLVASSRTELLEEIAKREIRFAGGRVKLDVGGAAPREIAMSPLTRFLNVLVDPNVAVILLLAGVLGLYVEFNQPGTLVPGVIGGVCLLLALVAMQILPFSWLGLLLMAVGLALLVAEAFVTSWGALFVAGLACFLLGGSMLFDRPELSDLDVSFWSVLLPAVTGFALFGGIVVFALGRTLGRPQTAGVGELLGLVGESVTPIAPQGTVFVRGEHWRAKAPEPIGAHERVEIVAVQGLELTVRRAKPED